MNYDNFIYKIGTKFETPLFVYAAVVIYKVLLDLIYCKYVAGLYTFFSFEPSVVNTVNGWLAVLVMAPFIIVYNKQKTCSALILITLNMVYFVPITTYCGYGGGSSSFLFFAILYWLFLSLLQIKFPLVGLRRENNSYHISNKAGYIVIALVSIFSIYIWYKYSGLRIQINILDVYDIRSQASKNGLPTILSYLWHVIQIIVPMFMVLMLYKKKYLLVVWLLFITLINFSYAGNKSIILFPLILIGGYIFYRKNMISLIFPAGVLLEICAIIEQKIGSVYITSLFFRRQGMVLAQLSENYYRFFLENPTDIFRSSIVGKFGFDSIYSNTLARVIGNNFETQNVNCNNGLLADVWSGIGIMGLIVMPIILIICLRFLDFVSYKIDMRLMIGLVVYYALMFANTTWSTVLLTHGFIVMCFVLILFPREKADKLRLNV